MPAGNPLGYIIDPNDPWGAALQQAREEGGTDYTGEEEMLAMMRERAKQLRESDPGRMDWASQANRAAKGMLAGYEDKKLKEGTAELGKATARDLRRGREIAMQNRAGPAPILPGFKNPEDLI